ncbi:hypothetical protein P3342_002229 [Pyrenophora teres f. teres]|nr:hypothetical protein P3342_002229 [Pyrenophora teres f. teres]
MMVMIRGKAHAQNGPSMSACNLTHQSIHAMGFRPPRSSIAATFTNWRRSWSRKHNTSASSLNKACASVSLSFCDGALDTNRPKPLISLRGCGTSSHQPAAMGVIADLFSCGRSRRTRELSTEPHLTNDATPQLHVPGLELEHVAHETTAPGHKATADTANDIRVPTIAPVPSPVQQSVHHWDRGRSRSRDSNTLDFSIHHEKGKLSAGWMLEQRVLVTTTTTTPSSRNSTPAPEPQKEDAASTLVRCPTPEEEPWNATVRAATPEPQVETSDASMLVRCATPEEEPWNASFRHATPEPEAASIRCATPEPQVIHVIRTATPEPEPQQITLPVEEEEEVAPVVSVVEEVRSATPEPEVEVEHVEVTKQTAPACLLDLPPEVRNRIYERMNDDEPIRMCRHDDPALAPRDGETAPAPKRQFYNLTQVCHQLRSEFLPIYAKKTHYIIDLWSQKANLAKVDTLQGQVSMDIDAACFDMEPIDLLPLIRTLVRKNRTDCQFTSTEGVVFRSIAEIVAELNKLLPKTDGSTKSWLNAINGPMKRIDLHLFPTTTSDSTTASVAPSPCSASCTPQPSARTG